MEDGSNEIVALMCAAVMERRECFKAYKDYSDSIGGRFMTREECGNEVTLRNALGMTERAIMELAELLTPIQSGRTSLQNMPTCTNSQTVVWRNIESDGLPPCNGEDWFLGANSQGAMCCFNFLDDTGMCWYCGPEDNAQLMDGLLWWAKVDAPGMTPNAEITGGPLAGRPCLLTGYAAVPPEPTFTGERNADV